jgi:hypothetical protein
MARELCCPDGCIVAAGLITATDHRIYICRSFLYEERALAMLAEQDEKKA